MAKMIPGGAPDQSAFFLSRQAAASEALVRLYVSLLAKYNENREGEDFKREMFDKGADLQNEMLDKRLAISGPQQVDPYGPHGDRLSGGANADRRDTPAPVDTPPPPPARQPQPSSAPLGGGAQPLPSGQFSQNGTSGATDFSSRNMSPEAANAMAQAPGGDALERRIKPTKSTERPVNALPGPATGKKAQAAVFVPGMDPKLVDHFEQVEQKYGLPRHTLMTVLGRENDGGRFAGRHGSAEGWFQFTDSLAKEYALKPGDRQDPYKMAEYAAMNMVRNNDELKRINQGRGLSNDPQDIARWGILHQFGHTNGPMFLVAQQLNPGLAATAAMKPRANPNDNAQILSNNGIASNTTVGDLVNHQAGKYVPYTNEALKLAGDRPVATRPNATKTGVPSTAVETNVNEANTPPLMQRAPPKIKPQSAIPGGDAYAQGGEAGSERPFGTRTQQETQTSASSASTPPRPPANIPILHNARALYGVNRRLVDAVRGGAELALPQGYVIRAVSGREGRTDSRSYHSRGQAADFQIIKPNGEAIPHKGEDTTGLYTLLARGVKTWVQENDPSAERSIGYGGAFGTQIGGGGVPDLMHYDWGGSRGRMRPAVQFARLQPLQPHERGQRGEPTQPRVQVAGPLPAPVAKELPKLPPGVVRTEKNLYEPEKRPYTPAEGFTPKGQFEPTHFGAQPVSTSMMDPWGRLKATPEAKVLAPKVSTQGSDEAGMIANDPPSLLGRSGESELAPEYRPPPLPHARPDTESGDLAGGTPADILPPDPNAADSADSTLIPMPKSRPSGQIAADTSLEDLRAIEEARVRGGDYDLTALEQAGKDMWGDMGIQNPVIPPSKFAPLPKTIPTDEPPDPASPEEYPDAAAAVAGGVTPAQRYNYNDPAINISTHPFKEQPVAPEQGFNAFDPSRRQIGEVLGAAGNVSSQGAEAPAATTKQLASAIYGKLPSLPTLPNMSLETGQVVPSPKSTPLPTLEELRKQAIATAPSEDAATPDDSDQAPGVGNQMQWLQDRFKQYQGIEAERDAAKPTLDQIGSWLKENFAPRNIPDERRPFGGEYKGVAGQVEGAARDAANMSPEERKTAIRNALFPSQETITSAMDKARTIGKAMQDWYNSPSKPAQPAVPTTPAKPNVVNKPPTAPVDPNKFVAPKMMPDGVTPWLANSAGAPKQGPLHHIKPPPSKAKTPDLLDPSVAVQENKSTAKGKGPPPPPGTQPQPADEPPVNYNPATGKFKAPPLPTPEAVDAIQPVEPD